MAQVRGLGPIRVGVADFEIGDYTIVAKIGDFYI